MKILLISGHGAGDSGAIGNGFKEANLTRELVNLIKPKLSKYASVDVYNQNRNAFQDVQRGQFRIGSYDYVLEVHFNAYNGSAYGTEIYVTDREKGVTVEQQIMNNLGKYFVKRAGTGVKVKNFLVINTVKSKGISSALLETCFIDNTNDMRIYQANKNAIAQDIVNGIVAGFGLGTVTEEKPAPTVHYYQRFNSNSIVDGLKSINVDSSFQNRLKIAKANGITNYTGTASQNVKLCDLARQGKLKK